MSWQPAYALLIAFTTGISYWIGLKSDTEKIETRKFYLVISLIVNLGVLFFFKYFNFLNENIRELVSFFGVEPYSFKGFDILLPVGISFYTFQTLSYNIDIYYGVRKPEKHLGIYALYVSFFPQLVAGPIERSTALLPQFFKESKFSFERFHAGLKYIIWGFFKKVVIADRLSVYVNEVYNNPANFDGIAFGFVTVLFAFQLYCDFSAYSDIAKGTAKILGYDLMENFNHPFKSKNITEFWRRWHISLSTWLRDYLYNPIVFSYKKLGKKAILLSIFITFFLCGLWHGAKITFIIFGLLQSFALVYELVSINFRKKLKNKLGHWFYNNLSLFITFSFVLFSFIFFRANTTSDALLICSKIFSTNYSILHTINLIGEFGNNRTLLLLVLLVGFVLFDKPLFNLVKGTKSFGIVKEQIIFSLLVALILVFGYFGEVEFIYFQF